jgi:membrane protease YdiL (CAAX protease family)
VNNLPLAPTTPAVRFSRRWFLLVELLIVAALFYGDFKHLVPFSKTPFLLLLAWLSLRLRNLRWKDVGLDGSESLSKTILIGVSAGIGIELLELFVTQPFLVHLSGKMPDLSQFQILRHNPKMLLIGLVLTWTLAAFGEEMVYRGYLMNRIAGLGGDSRLAWMVSLILVNMLFGAAHMGQGITGMIENAIDGTLLGVLYLRGNCNLATPIIAHGITDTVDLLLLFLGRYPGI